MTQFQWRASWITARPSPSFCQRRQVWPETPSILATSPPADDRVVVHDVGFMRYSNAKRPPAECLRVRRLSQPAGPRATEARRCSGNRPGDPQRDRDAPGG